MRIRCPWCGERPSEEFTYLGDATVVRPDGLADSPAGEWVDYVYFRDNPAGAHSEYWQHSAGCRSWLIVQRDTTTHEISTVTLAQAKARDRDA